MATYSGQGYQRQFPLIASPSSGNLPTQSSSGVVAQAPLQLPRARADTSHLTIPTGGSSIIGSGTYSTNGGSSITGSGKYSITGSGLAGGQSQIASNATAAPTNAQYRFGQSALPSTSPTSHSPTTMAGGISPTTMAGGTSSIIGSGTISIGTNSLGTGSVVSGSSFGASTPVQTGVKVDPYEDLVEPGLHAKRVTGLNRRALHGANIRDALSGHEHVKDIDVVCQFEPNPSASQVANTIVQQAMVLAQIVDQEGADCFDKSWFGPQGKDTLYSLFNNGNPMKIVAEIETLSSEVRQLLISQPTLVEASAPAKVYGDIHGQLRDVLLQLLHFGFPQNQGPEFIFNGDWVDRGAHQVEVVCLIYALKAMYPNRVWILRGNHEDIHQNRCMGPNGFEFACNQRFGPQLGARAFMAIGQTFDYLPLACLIDRKILVVHGGIGDGQWTLNQLAAVQRPIGPEGIHNNSVIYNVLWSDPIADDPGQEVFGVHDSPRNGGGSCARILTFGKPVTERFCAQNNIEMIVRSHQAIARGFGYDIMHGGRCVRVFSARDYEGQGNDGAILSIVQGEGHLLARAQVVRSFACPKADGTPLVERTPQGGKRPSLKTTSNPFGM